MHKILIVGLLTASAIISGCASMTVTNESLEQNTAFALGINKGDFTISNRVDEGVKTTYSVKTKSGQQYNCYVTGTVGVTGRVVSDAICNKVGEPAKNPLLNRKTK